MSMRSLSPESRPPLKPHSAYHLREVPEPDAELTRTGPGTPMGEYRGGRVGVLQRHCPHRGADDKELLLELDRRLLALIQEGVAVPRAERDRHIRRRLDELEKEMANR